MVRFLMDNPGALWFLNCCVGPVVCIVFGYLVGRYRPRIRTPFVIDQPGEEGEF